MPSPIVAGDLVIVTGGYPPGGRPIYAIRPGRHRASSPRRRSPGTPIAARPTPARRSSTTASSTRCTDNGILSAYEPKTGERIYQQRVAGGSGFSASPVAADGRLYLASEDGDVFVVKAGRTLRAAWHQPHGRTADGDAGHQRQHHLHPHAVVAGRGEMTRPTCGVRVRVRELDMTPQSLRALRVAGAVARGLDACRRRRRPIVDAVSRLGGVAGDDAGDACRRSSRSCGPTRPAMRSTRPRRSPTASSTSVRANGQLHAVNLADGKPKWKYQASSDGIGESSPAVANGLVYVGDLAGSGARGRRRPPARRPGRSRPAAK